MTHPNTPQRLLGRARLRLRLWVTIGLASIVAMAVIEAVSFMLTGQASVMRAGADLQFWPLVSWATVLLDFYALIEIIMAISAINRATTAVNIDRAIERLATE